MRRRWAKTLATRSADCLAFHDTERTGDGRSLYRAHENLSCGARGGGGVLCVFSLLGPHLRANGILEEKALANANLRPGYGTFSTVPGDAGCVHAWQQIVIPVQEKTGSARQPPGPPRFALQKQGAPRQGRLKSQPLNSLIPCRSRIFRNSSSKRTFK